MVVVNIKSKRRLPRPLALTEIKAIEELSDFDLVRLPRLSVMPVSREQWDLLANAMKVKELVMVQQSPQKNRILSCAINWLRVYLQPIDCLITNCCSCR